MSGLKELTIEEIILPLINQEDFKNALLKSIAWKVSDSYHYDDIEGRLIKPEIREIIKHEAESIVNDYLDNYFEANNIEQVVRSMTDRLLKERISQVLVAPTQPREATE